MSNYQFTKTASSRDRMRPAGGSLTALATKTPASRDGTRPAQGPGGHKATVACMIKVSKSNTFVISKEVEKDDQSFDYKFCK